MVIEAYQAARSALEGAVRRSHIILGHYRSGLLKALAAGRGGIGDFGGTAEVNGGVDMPARRKPKRWATSAPATLGIDIGGVIVARGEGLEDTNFFGSRPMDTPPLPGAIDAISVLAGARFADRVHLVSKAGPRIAGISIQWLHQSGLLTATGLTEREVHFVRERSEKAKVCAELGITHFVDDRLSVLNVMPEVPFRYLFTGGLSAAQKVGRIDVPPGIVAVDDWPSLHRLLTEERQS